MRSNYINLRMIAVVIARMEWQIVVEEDLPGCKEILIQINFKYMYI